MTCDASCSRRSGIRPPFLFVEIQFKNTRKALSIMAKSLSIVFIVVALSVGCSSPVETSGTSAEHVLPAHLCPCGDPQADAEGCANQCFLDPDSQCLNPKCTCTVNHMPTGMANED